MLTCSNGRCAKSGPEAAVARGLRLVNRRTGIIQRLYEHLLDPDDPRLFYCTAKMADTSVYGPNRCAPYNGGASREKTRAKAAAIGESIERYCAGSYDEQAFIRASYDERLSRGEAMAPGRLALFSERQYALPGFKFSPFRTQTPMAWVQGYSLTRTRPILVPACCVYVPYRFHSPAEMILHPTSTGLAAATCLEEAILSGIYEVVERDAFMIAWHQRLSLSRIDLAAASSPALQEVIGRFEPSGLELHAVNITLDIPIPVAAAVVIRRPGGEPAAAVGAAARLDPQQAVLKALEEAGHTFFWVRSMMKGREGFGFRDDFADITDLSHHPLLYGYRRMLPHLEFMVGSRERTGISDLPDRSLGSTLLDLEHCVRVLAEKGLEVIAVNITTPDVAEAGFHVVRVVIPGLQPLDVEFRSRYLGGKRLYRAPAALGLATRNEAELNPYPHPFP